MRWQRILVAALATVLSGGAVRAESVLVSAGDGGFGHAWLFGSAGRHPGECWLALPAHLLRDGPGERIRAVTFELSTGRHGEPGPPHFATAVDGKGRPLDLAFARAPGVTTCLSRLGLPDLTYRLLFQGAAPLTIASRLASSVGVFPATIAQASPPEAGAQMVLLRPREAADGPSYLRQGLSGATAMVERGGELHPFAMVTSVTPDQAAMMAIRFDTIRAAFDAADEADDRARTEAAASAPGGLPYAVLAFDGISLDGGGPGAAWAAGRCWRVAPEGGRRQVSVTLAPSDPSLRISRIAVVRAPGCAEAGVAVTVEQRRRDGAAWSRVSDCRIVAAAGDGCRIDLRGERQYRIRIDADGPIALSAPVLD